MGIRLLGAAGEPPPRMFFLNNPPPLSLPNQRSRPDWTSFTSFCIRENSNVLSEGGG